jgi:hypothetical protein
MVMTDLDHLAPAAQELAKQPDEIRIGRILADRWIGYTRAVEAIKKLEWLLRHPKRLRMPNLLLVGPTNNGKTMITERFRRDHGQEKSSDPGIDIIPVLRVQTPNTADPRRFYNAILTALGPPERPGDALAKKEQQAVHLLRRTGVRVLVIDEIHNVLAGTTPQLNQMLNLLRYLGNELQIPLVAVGVKEALQVIHSDDQLANRFEPFALPRWEYGVELNNLLASLEYTLPLHRSSSLTNPVFARRVIAMSEGILGEIVTLVTRSAEMAVKSGIERIEVETLDRIDYLPPSQRRASAAAMRVD